MEIFGTYTLKIIADVKMDEGAVLRTHLYAFYEDWRSSHAGC